MQRRGRSALISLGEIRRPTPAKHLRHPAVPCPTPPRPALPITESAHVFRKCAFFAKCFVNVSAPNFIISWHEGGAKENAASHHIATRRIAAPQEAEKREKALRKLCKLSDCRVNHTARNTQQMPAQCMYITPPCQLHSTPLCSALTTSPMQIRAPAPYLAASAAP